MNKIEQNLKDYARIQKELDALKVKYREQLLKGDTAQKMADRLYRELHNNAREKVVHGLESHIKSLEKENGELKESIAEKDKALTNLRSSYQDCKGLVFKLKGKRVKAAKGDAYPPY